MHTYFNSSFSVLLGSDWVNPEDPNVIAENELLGAAASIEAAARKLAELKPRARPKVEPYFICQPSPCAMRPMEIISPRKICCFPAFSVWK